MIMNEGFLSKIRMIKNILVKTIKIFIFIVIALLLSQIVVFFCFSNPRPWQCFSLMNDAASRGNILFVKMLMYFGGDINNVTCDRTPLIYASRYGKTKMVEFLINNGANVNYSDRLCNNALSEALSYNYYETADILLSNGFVINGKQKDCDLLSPFSCSGEKESIEWLLRHGADAGDSKALFTVLSCSQEDQTQETLNNAVDVVKLLVASGAKINDVNQRKDTPLHYAAEGKHKVFVEYLVSRGAKINVKNNAGNTPLHKAVISSNCNADIVKYLIANGADVSARNNEGQNPFYYAPECKNYEEISPLFKNSKKHGQR